MELAFAAAQAPYVDMMGVGDAACSLLGPEVYEELVLPRQERLIRGVQALGLPVRLHVCGRTDQLFPGISRLGVEMMDVDALADLSLARRVLGRRVVLLGNCDPVTVLLEGSPDSVRAAFEGCWREAGWPFVVGPGCEIPPETPAANVEAMMDFARQTAPGL
jgi:uroporphyrinogen-III decarboxylase